MFVEIEGQPLFMANGTATKILKFILSCNFTKEATNMKTGYYDVKSDASGVTFHLTNQKNENPNLSVTFVKLFYIIIACSAANAKDDLYVQFDERAYYRLNGWAIDPRPDDNGNISEREKYRSANALKQARRTMRKDLDTLYDLSLSWSEEIGRGKKKTTSSYRKTRIIQSQEINNGIVTVQLGTDFAAYLKSLPLTTLRREILIINAKKPHELRIGLKLCELWYNRLAANQGHNNLIGVQNILNASGLPSLDTVRERKKSWSGTGIKKPFEDALNDLIDIGLLVSWTYKNEKKPGSYAEWASQSIIFEIDDTHSS